MINTHGNTGNLAKLFLALGVYAVPCFVCGISTLCSPWVACSGDDTVRLAAGCAYLAVGLIFYMLFTGAIFINTTKCKKVTSFVVDRADCERAHALVYLIVYLAVVAFSSFILPASYTVSFFILYTLLCTFLAHMCGGLSLYNILYFGCFFFWARVRDDVTQEYELRMLITDKNLAIGGMYMLPRLVLTDKQYFIPADSVEWYSTQHIAKIPITRFPDNDEDDEIIE